MCISRSPADTTALKNKIIFDRGTLDLSESINILGVEFDCKLSFEAHIKDTALKASRKITTLRKMRHLLDAEGLQTIYKSQIRSVMEYSPLAWMSSPPTHLNLLDKVQRRAEKLITSAHHGECNISLDTLDHRRRVASLTVLHACGSVYESIPRS